MLVNQGRSSVARDTSIGDVEVKNSHWMDVFFLVFQLSGDATLGQFRTLEIPTQESEKQAEKLFLVNSSPIDGGAEVSPAVIHPPPLFPNLNLFLVCCAEPDNALFVKTAPLDSSLSQSPHAPEDRERHFKLRVCFQG